MTNGDGAGRTSGGFDGLLTSLDRLEARRVHYELLHTRDSVMVDSSLPGWRWEVEFMSDGSIEIERYRSVGEVETDPAILESIFDDA